MPGLLAKEVSIEPSEEPPPPGGDSHMKQTGMLVVSRRVVNFLIISFFCLSIPKRDSNTKKTTPNIEVCPKASEPCCNIDISNVAYCCCCCWGWLILPWVIPTSQTAKRVVESNNVTGALLPLISLLAVLLLGLKPVLWSTNWFANYSNSFFTIWGQHISGDIIITWVAMFFTVSKSYEKRYKRFHSQEVLKTFLHPKLLLLIVT